MATALVFAWGAVHVLLVIAMSRAQMRYIRRYREHHQVNLPMAWERPSVYAAPLENYRATRRILRSYFEPQAAPDLERLRRRVLLCMGSILGNWTVGPLLYIAYWTWR